MAGYLQKLAKKLFGSHLELRERLFNVLVIIGTTVSATNAAVYYFLGDPVTMLLGILGALFSGCLLWYITTSGKYNIGYILTIVAVFLCLFPTLFFAGNKFSMFFYFLFAILFTVFMLRGKVMIFFAVFLLAVYTSLSLYVIYFMPDYNGDKALLLNVTISFIVATTVISIAMGMYIRLYDRQQLELIKAKKTAEAYAKLKSDLVAELSHELRTPLAVMSGYAQYAVEQIRKNGMSEKTLDRLGIVSEEAQRLAELADDTLDLLKTVRDTDDKDRAKREPQDIGIIAEKVAALQKPLSQKIGITLQTRIEDGLPEIFGDAGDFTQVIWNILQNAMIHSGADVVTVEAKTSGVDTVVLQISDNGNGIPPDIFGRVFERGVSGAPGRSGLGLPISREIIENYGGKISIESHRHAGTTVTIRLRDRADDFNISISESKI